MNAQVMHKDLTTEAILKCNDMYEQFFLQELEQMCPIDKHPEVSLEGFPRNRLKLRERKFISAIMIITMVMVTAISVAGVTQATISSNSIADIKTEMERQLKTTQMLAKERGIIAIAVKNLEDNFNTLLDRIQNVTADITEIKNKQISTEYAIAYVTTRLLTAKLLI